MKELPTDEEMEESAKRYLEMQRSYAISLRYDRNEDVFILVLRAGSTLLIPRIAVEELRDVTDLENVVLNQYGGSIRYEPLDIDISVPGLVRDMTGAAVWLKLAGSKKTPAKAKASRANGLKGGRPKKAIAA